MTLQTRRESLGTSLVRFGEVMREEGKETAASFNPTGEAGGLEVVLTFPGKLIRAIGHLVLPGSV